MKLVEQSARAWLQEHGYSHVNAMIDEIMSEWKTAGKKTRRDWWEACAGDKNGSPRVIEGRTFPVIKALRDRQGLKPVKSAISNGRKERAPRAKPQQRWLAQ